MIKKSLSHNRRLLLLIFTLTDILLPAGKDVNDLSPEEVDTLIQTS